MCTHKDRERVNRNRKQQNETKKNYPYHHHILQVSSLSLSNLFQDRSDVFTPPLILQNETELIFPIGLL